MPMASARDGFHSGLRAVSRANTAAKDDAVCPEGKEASVGGAISSFTSGFTAKGRTLPIHGFSQRLHSSRSTASPQARHAPAFLVFGIASKTAASRIQTSPWLQIQLTAGIAASRIPQRRWD